MARSDIAVKDFVPVPFDELGKDAATLLNIDLKKDWIPVASNDTVKWDLKSINGVKTLTKVERQPDGKVSGQIELRLPTTKGLSLEPTFYVDTKKKVKFGASQSNKLVYGLKVTTTVEALLEKKTADLKLAFDYKRANFAYNAQFTLPLAANYVPSLSGEASVKTAAVFGYAVNANEVSAGAEVEYLLAKQYLKAVNAFAAFTNVLSAPSTWTVGAYHRMNFTLDSATKAQVVDKRIAGLLVSQKFPRFFGPSGAVAAQLEYDLKKEKDNVTLAVGTAWDAVAGGRVHLKLNTQNQVQASFSQKLADNANLRVGAELSGDTASVTKSFIELSFTD